MCAHSSITRKMNMNHTHADEYEEAVMYNRRPISLHLMDTANGGLFDRIHTRVYWGTMSGDQTSSKLSLRVLQGNSIAFDHWPIQTQMCVIVTFACAAKLLLTVVLQPP